jgi:hypothetical protein
MMSFTNTVPAVVPSVFHSSAPSAVVVAVKYSVSPTTRNSFGADDPKLPLPVLMSFTSTVPAAVPSVRHSSRPLPSWALKNSRPWNATKSRGDEKPAPA